MKSECNSLGSESKFIVENREIAVGGLTPTLRGREKLVRKTLSLCPECYRILPAVIFEREGKIWIRRICPEHGEVEEVYWGDSRLYYKAMEWSNIDLKIKVANVEYKYPCPFSCGLCPIHKNYTSLVNIVLTNRCNLTCWYCFFYAEKAGFVYEPSLKTLREMVREVKKQHPYGGALAVQLTGGEPTLRDDLVDIVKMLKEEGIRHIQLNTNGLVFSYSNGSILAKQLRDAGVNTVYLSFDGVSPKVNFKNHWEIPYILENFRKGNMRSVVLVPTVIKGWNTDELGAIIRFAAENIDVVRGVNFQPVSLTGLMPRSEREKYRITIPEVIKLIEEQTDGEIPVDAWYPVPITIPLSRFIIAFTGKHKLLMNVHPACGMATYVYVDKRGGKVHFIPISEFIDIDGFFNYLSEKADEIESGANKYIVGLKVIYNILTKFIKRKTLPDGTSLRRILLNIFLRHNYEALAVFHYKFLFLGMMHFMDLYNYDIERVKHCAIHYVTPDKRVIPFCAFNVIPDVYRDAIQRKYGIDLEEWVKMKGYKSWSEAFPKHKRDISKLTKGEPYRKAYANFKEYLSKE